MAYELPEWLNPKETPMDAMLKGTEAGSNIARGALQHQQIQNEMDQFNARLPLIQQAQEDAHTEAQLRIAGDAVNLQQRRIQMQNNLDDLQTFQNSAPEFMSASPEDRLSFKDPVFKDPKNARDWMAWKTAQLQSGSDAVLGGQIASDVANFKQRLAGIDASDRASIISLAKQRQGNPNIPSSDEWDALDAAERTVRERNQQMKESLAAVRPTIAGQFGVDRASIIADWHKYVADSVADARNYATDANKQINADKLAAKLQEQSYDFLPHAEYDALHQKMEDIRATAKPKERQALIEKAFNDAVAEHKARLATQPAPTPTAPAAGDGSSQDHPKPVTSQEEYDSAPSGTWVVDPSGKVGRKP